MILFVLRIGCAVVVSAIVWSVSLSTVPVGFTIGSTGIYAWVYRNQPEGLGRCLFQAILTGALSLAAWWAMNHIHV